MAAFLESSAPGRAARRGWTWAPGSGPAARRRLLNPVWPGVLMLGNVAISLLARPLAGMQRERPRRTGTDDGEVPPVQGCYVRSVEPLGDGDHRRIDATKR